MARRALSAYNAKLPALCHEYLSVTDSMSTENLNNLYALITETGGNAAGDIRAFCAQYLDVFNTGIHYSFIASVCAMLLSLLIFVSVKKNLPTPGKKAKAEGVRISDEERRAMAKEIKQRMTALFAVLGVVIFFRFSFHRTAHRCRSSPATLSTPHPSRLRSGRQPIPSS